MGVVVHSLPITKEIGDALGIHSDREGWVVAYKVYDDAVWVMVKIWRTCGLQYWRSCYQGGNVTCLVS